MTAVLGGLGAAIIWAAGSTFASRATRVLGPRLTLAWVMLVGLVALGLILPWTGAPHLTAAAVFWLVLSGAGNVAGLLILYHALRIGQLGVVMPIVTTEGGIAALLAILAGEPLHNGVAWALLVTVIGVIMTAIARRPAGSPSSSPATSPSTSTSTSLSPEAETAAESAGGRLTRNPPDHPRAVPTPTGHHDRRAAAWAIAGAVSFGIGLFATGRASHLLPTAWAVLPPRLIGVAVITLPMALSRQLRVPRGVWPALLVAGLCELAGFFAYATGTHHGIAVTAVLATLTGVIGAGSGRLFFGERLQRTQVLGIAVTFAGVATLAGLTA
ncbi:MAG TPA: DMT family transporter [Solirubrobacteraceae bacterium]|jgi:drug/metabolite transporter (DMT)-like permease|nr:DMT family transporter [Solirubrobacteraceae bacterium]